MNKKEQSNEKQEIESREYFLCIIFFVFVLVFLFIEIQSSVNNMKIELSQKESAQFFYEEKSA